MIDVHNSIPFGQDGYLSKYEFGLFYAHRFAPDINVVSKFIYEQKTLRRSCIHYTSVYGCHPEHLFQRSGGVESCVVSNGFGSRSFSAIANNTCSYMKTQLSGTFNVPASGIPAVSEPVNALTEQVNNLQRRYYRRLAPDCEVKTVPDKWYIRVIGWTCAGFLFPPLLAVAALCAYKAKKCQEGGKK